MIEKSNFIFLVLNIPSNLLVILIAVFVLTAILLLYMRFQAKNLRELKLSEERLSLALNVVEDGIWDWNIPTAKIFFSKRWLDILGYDEGEISGDYDFWIKLIHPDDVSEMSQKLYSHLEGKSPIYRSEYRMLTKSKEWKWILDRGRIVTRDVKGHPLRMLGIHQDISVRKKMENILQESENKFRSFVEQSTDGIVLISSEGIVQEWNKGAELITGLPQSQTVGKSYRQIITELLADVPPENRKSDLTEAFSKFIQSKDSKWINRTFETVIKHSHKPETFIEQLLFPIRSEQGLIIGNIIRDITKRKQYETKISENERRFRELADLLPQSVFETDAKGKLTFINKISYEFFDVTPEEFEKDLSIFQYVAPADMKKAKSNFLNTLKQDKTAYEYNAIKKDGTTIPVIVHASPIIRNNKVIGLRGIVTDISEQKRNAELIKESEERFRSLVENQSEGVSIIDAKENIIYSNPAADIIFGVYPDTIAGRNFEEFLDDKELQLVKENTSARLKGEKTTFEVQINRPDGEKRILNFNGAPYSLKHTKGTLAVFSDITENKKVDDKLRQLSQAVHYSPNTIVITDIKGNIEYVNPKFTESTGYTYDEVIGKNPRILKSGEFSKEDYKNLWVTIMAGKEWKGEFHNKRKNGELYWELASISPIKNSAGETIHFVAIKEDITERKRQEQELITAKEVAEKSDRLKSEFLAQMSHEIRTPINTILSFTSLLKDELSDKVPEDLKHSFRIIDNGGRRLIRTIDLILDMSKIQTGNFEQNICAIDLEKEIIENLIFDFLPLAKEKKIKFGYVNCNVTKKIIGDNYVITQIFSNLIDNAIKYTMEGSVEIVLNETGNEVHVNIKDSGIGISENYLPYLFTSFSQEETGYTRRFEGTGLGLALVKKYAELSQAEISVSSKKGKGTIFTVIFRNLA